MANQSSLKVSIANKHYLVNCPEGNELALQKAATDLDERICLATHHSGNAEQEQTMVMVALNLAHELHRVRTQFREFKQQTQVKVTDVSAAIGKANVD